ncbi:transposable element Tcb1 transposase [Trichonephila clavipes]|uniref:Transposable element Tcb1 transposase n=1 Tax=Trichonephila clavipes TaxID=2585209 RepID=A0A8X6SSR4_TRICX|nr:transposable element Tcb1 transposase [Trichonephila clavipes]
MLAWCRTLEWGTSSDLLPIPLALESIWERERLSRSFDDHTGDRTNDLARFHPSFEGELPGGCKRPFTSFPLPPTSREDSRLDGYFKYSHAVKMQESTTDRSGRSHPPQCTTSREYRQIERMAVTDRSVTSRTIEQNIESVTHHSVSLRMIRRRLQQSGLSARRPLLGLPLTQNHRRLRRQWCDERRMWAAE